MFGEFREQLACLGVEQLLRGRPAHPLHEAADHLAAVDGGIERSADVDQDVHARDRELAGQAVDLHLGDGGAVGEIEEGVAPAGLAVEVDPGRGVEPARTQVDAFLVGEPDELAEAEPAAGPAVVDHAARSNGRAPAKARSRRRARRSAGGRLGEPLLQVLQARSAAVPFRSVLAEAAVGEVLLFFSVEAGITRTASIGIATHRRRSGGSWC